MKKTILLFVTTLFVLAAVFAAIPVQTAKADGPGGGYEDITPPFATSGSYERIPADKFEGSVEANGMYLPKWDDLGAMQYHMKSSKLPAAAIPPSNSFSRNGILVGMEQSTAGPGQNGQRFIQRWNWALKMDRPTRPPM